MSTPNPFAIDPDHKDCIMEFVGKKAEEDGIDNLEEQVDLLFEYWDLIIDPVAIENECNAMELERLEQDQAKAEEAVTEIPKEIARRKKKKKARSTTKKVTPEPETPVDEDDGSATPNPATREDIEKAMRDSGFTAPSPVTATQNPAEFDESPAKGKRPTIEGSST